MVSGIALATVACTGSGDDCAVAVVVPDARDASLQDSAATGDAMDATSVDGEASGDGGAAGDVAFTLGPTMAALRVANWSADAPGVDFCLAPKGTTAFQRPVLAALAGAIDEAGVIDAGAATLAFPHASAYFLVAPGQYDARIVAGGSGDCAAKIVDGTGLPPVAAGQSATIALFGAAQPAAGQPPLSVAGFLDDTAPPVDGVAIRAINAAPDSHLASLDVGTLSGASATYAPLFVSVPFGATSGSAANRATAKLDPNGYAMVLGNLGDGGAEPKALSKVAVVARTSGAPNNAAQASNVTVVAGAVVTIVVVGTRLPSATSPIAQLLECVDNAGASSLDGACTIISM